MRLGVVQQCERMFPSANTDQSRYGQLARKRPDLDEVGVMRLLCDELLHTAAMEPPIDMEILASIRGVISVERTEQPWSGLIVPGADGRHRIRVNQEDSPERQRFTIGHETGHTLLPGFAEQTRFRCDPGASAAKELVERLSDFAASELLFPRQHFTADIASSTADFTTVEQLAFRYDASIEATARRLVRMWPTPSMLIVLEERNKPADRPGIDPPALRVAYHVADGPTLPFIPRHKSASPTSVFARAWSGDPVDERSHINDLVATCPKTFHVSARKYGERVLALLTT
jgi:hypothetical protein